jgi:isopropylmalate/homocitrate/citramalate synthase
MTQPDKGHGNLLQKLSLMNINTLEEEQVEDFAKKIKSERRDEELSQLTIYTLEEVTARTFVRKLAEREKFQNWEIQEAPLVFKM